MENVWSLSVGREFCSGGAEVGHLVAQKLGIPFYDKNLIDETADMMMVSREVVERHDEKPMHVWEMPGTGYQYANGLYTSDPSLLMPVSFKVADAQFAVMRKVAEQGPCVVVGRCSNYVLRNLPNVLHVFLHAPMEARVARAMRLHNLSESDAIKQIRKSDKVRANYYNAHTGQKWGEPSGYDLHVDTTLLGTEGTAEMLVQLMCRLTQNGSNTFTL